MLLPARWEILSPQAFYAKSAVYSFAKHNISLIVGVVETVLITHSLILTLTLALTLYPNTKTDSN